MQTSLVLATGSPYKRRLMQRLGLNFETCPADIDESCLNEESPEQTARRLAGAKARAVSQRRPRAYVIGADQVIALGDTRFSKPGSPDKARRQLAQLSGKTHHLITAVAVVRPDGTLYDAVADYRMQMRTLSDDEIAAYVAEDSPTDCAGAYKIEAGGIRLFRALRGDDYTAIVGLPLTRVWHLLEDAGYVGER
jgi:septum formation protein